MVSVAFVIVLVLGQATAKDSASLFRIPAATCHLSKNFIAGTALECDGPFQISKKVKEKVRISEDSGHFALFPDILHAGQSFGITVKHRSNLSKAESLSFKLTGKTASGAKEVVPVTVLFDRDPYEIPQLDSFEYLIEVTDPLPEGVLRKFRVQNPDRTLPTAFQYELTGKNSDFFSIEAADPDLVLLRSHGCQGMCGKLPRTMALLMTIRDGNRLPGNILLNIFFKPEPYLLDRHPVIEANLTENDEMFDKLVRVEGALDGQDVLFELDPPSEVFKVHPRSGVLSIQNPAEVSVEHLGESHQLIVLLKNERGRLVGRRVIKLHVAPKPDDKEAIFNFEKSSYHFTVQPGSRVVDVVRAEPKVADLVYKAIGDASDFHVDPKDGTITYKGLARKENKNYTITVSAQTAKSLAQCKVEIEVIGAGTETPQFTRSVDILHVGQEQLDGRAVYKFQAEDPDASEGIEYSITKLRCHDSTEQLKECFASMDLTADGVLTLADAGEVQAAELTVQGRDKLHVLEGAAEMTLVVFFSRNHRESDVPEWAPNADVVHLPSNLVPGSFVARLSSMMPSGPVVFSIQPSNYFSIDDEGVITLSTEIEPMTYNVTVEVKDPSLNSTSTTHITIIVDPPTVRNDISTEFIEFDVDYDLQPGDIVGSVPPSVSHWKLREIPHEGDTLFTIDQEGRITVVRAVPQELAGTTINLLLVLEDDNSEIINFIPLYVNIRPGGATEAELTPTDSLITIYENSPIGAFVVATTAPGANCSLTLDGEAVRLRGSLAVDQDAVVRVSGSLRNLEGEYDIPFECSKGNRNRTTLIHVQSNYLGELRADHGIGCGLQFEVASHLPVFVNSKSGEITFNGSDSLTRERYFGAVTARSGAMESSINIEIQIPERVDNPPMACSESHARFELDENMASPTSIGVIGVDRLLKGAKFRLVKTFGTFEIDEASGMLVATRSLDREFRVTYELTVEVYTDADVKIQCSVTVTVHDQNDNPPKFEQARYEAVLDKDTVLGHKVVQVRASDPDEPDTHGPSIIYSIAEISFFYKGVTRKASQYFEIDPLSGRIRLIKKLQHMNEGIFDITVVATDNSETTSEHVATANVVVWVCEQRNLVSFVLKTGPAQLDGPKVRAKLNSLAKSSQHDVVLAEVRYSINADGSPDSDSTILKVLFVNEHARTLIPFEDVAETVGDLSLEDLTLLKSEELTKALGDHESLPLRTSMLVIFAAFTVLLGLLIICVSCMICEQRRKYVKKRRYYESMTVLNRSTNKQLNVLEPNPTFNRLYGQNATLATESGRSHASTDGHNNCSTLESTDSRRSGSSISEAQQVSIRL